MLMKKIQHQLELTFWDITIQALSENRLAQKVYREMYYIKQEPKRFQEWLAIGFTGLAGFISGLGVYLLVMIAR